jgi:cytochrome P450
VGTDTTATTIRTTMLYIMTNPRVYHKLQAEIDLTSRSGAVISDKQGRTLSYLQAVIKEGSRICPPATGILSKTVPAGGDTFKGRFIPGGTDIGQCLWAIQRSTEVYGHDSMAFRPERWLEAEGEQLERMEKSLALNWGYGKFSCLGKGIAMLELNKVFFEVN